MNDRKDLSPEDLAIEQAWDQVTDPGGEPRLARDGEADAERVREYTELLGLLPYALDAEAPPPAVKGRIMAQVAATAGGEASDAPAAPVVPFTRPAAPPAPPRSAWRFAQAALLAASLAGIVFLGSTVREQSRQIARLQNQVAATSLERAEVVRIREEAEAYRSRLHMVTNVARYAYPLHTVSTVSSGQKPEGIVYVCGAHRQWYLSLRGLEPPPEGAEYRLWFMTDGDKIDGGVLDVRAGASIEMEDVRLPDGTHGFAVTLEKQDTPESLTILLGDDVVNL